MKVLIMGAGAMGTATAWALAQRGHQVVAFERHSLGHAEGSSHGETRLIRRAYFENPHYVPLLELAYARWAELERDRRRQVFHPTGLVIFGKRGSSPTLDGVRESGRRHRIPLSAADAATWRSRYPVFRVPDDFEGVFEPGAGYLEVERAVEAMGEAARALGVEVREGVKVRGWGEQSTGVWVDTDQGKVTGDQLVVTAGAWARDLLAPFGVELTVHRNLLLWFGADGWGAEAPCFAFEKGEDFLYGFSPKGGTVKVANHVPGPLLAAPEDLRAGGPFADPRAEALVGEFLAGLDPRPRRVEPCLYTLTSDRHFVLDRLPGHPRVVVGAGFSGHGFKFAPAVGSILADKVEGREPSVEVGFLAMDRLRKAPSSAP